MDIPNRQFNMAPAVRRAVGLIIGIVAPSGAGKTFSALRLATGIQRVCGGDIAVIDTENGRALYYADKFKFLHVPFAAPFNSLDYLAAMRFCVSKGVKTIVTDSMSHEHEGQGGHLETFQAELDRLSRGDDSKRDRMKMLAWQKPKEQRKKLMLEMNQMNVNFISTFRAKEKLKLVTGKQPIEMGFQPIAGEELIYEMVLKMLLLPGAEGVPTWQSDYMGERAMIKLPDQFRPFFDRDKPVQIDEDLGQKLAEWAAGSKPGAEPPINHPAHSEQRAIADQFDLATLTAAYTDCEAHLAFVELEKRRAELWAKIPPSDAKTQLKAASDAAKARLTETGSRNP